MKKHALAALFTASILSLMAGPRDAQWKQVDEAVQKGLPRSAVQALAPIIQGALADRSWGEAVKAIAQKIVLEANIQGNKPEEKIARLESEITRAPQDIKPLLNTILAHWYWQYFQNNRWRFLGRTPTAASPGGDFTTWDLPRLYAEIDRRFSLALAGEKSLKNIPIATHTDLLSRGALPDEYRPTLYDFIAFEALSFYGSGEQAAIKPEDAFTVAADSDIFAPATQFRAWKLPSADTNSPIVKAIHLYQDLLRFHRADQDPSAFIDADLARLIYAKNVAYGENKNARYEGALKGLVDQWADHDISARALHEWASVRQQENDLVEARALALRGERAFPQSAGGKLCHNLIAAIEAKSLGISTERVWNKPWPKIQVRYRNLTNVWFRVVAYDWEALVERGNGTAANLNEEERKQLLQKAAAYQWTATLPPPTDYREASRDLPAPEALKPGFYFLLASGRPDFGRDDNEVSVASIWVSDLALVVRPRGGNIEGFVLAAESGDPITGAQVRAWIRDRQGHRIEQPVIGTDGNGFFSLPANNPGYVISARYQGRELAAAHDFAAYRPQPPAADERTIFFTDRALYRPGQIIQYKGICLRIDQEKDNYQVLGGRKVTVVFSDPNGKEIARQTRPSNDYGSFAGSFTAPRDRLMGAMQIRVENGPQGGAMLRVEEYKRPKFQVTLDAPKTAPKLNDTADLTGHALSYTGAAVDGASVQYRVVREVRMPPWWGWFGRRLPRQGESQEIAHGTTATASDGSFKIAFIAKPDLSVPEKDEPTFVYQVSADVTDTTGETRSAERRLNVGYTALAATLDADEWETKDKSVNLKIKTETLDGEGQAAEGTIKVYRLEAPVRVQRPGLAPSFGFGYRPVEAAGDMSNPNNWPPAGVVEEKGFTTDASGAATLSFNLGVGVYRAQLETQDRFGKKVTARFPLLVLDPGASRLDIKIPHLVSAPAWSVEAGQEFTAIWGTGYEQGRAFIEVEHRGKMLRRFWTKPGETQVAIKQAVTEAMRGGFTVFVTRVRENRAFLEARHIAVPWNNKNLEVKWEHFTSKLEPGQQETWTAIVRGPQAQKSVAEMAVTLYDASLDAFLPLDWPERFNFFRQDYTTANAEFANASEFLQPWQGSWVQNYVNAIWSYRTFPPWIVNQYRSYGIGGGMRLSRFADATGRQANNYSMAEERVAMPASVAANAKGIMQAPTLAKEPQLGVAFSGAVPAAAPLAPPKAPVPSNIDLTQVTARKNLNETAFFFPQLVSDSNGVVRMTFTMPEALTTWRLLGFVHDKRCRAGYLADKAITAKDLMVQPNPPRFLREGDRIEFTVKVSNQSPARQTGAVKLNFREARNQLSADAALGNTAIEQAFDIPAKESRSFSWSIKVPDGMGFLEYKTVGSTGRLSDGEEGYVPVLARRILVTESLPLDIRGPGTRKFEFKKLLAAGKSGTLRHQSLTVQMVSNPAWYAIMALPYLMEYPYECSEQTFNRFYANALARQIAASDPKIRAVFDQWRDTAALSSPLEKNPDLKSVAVEETPWLRQAESETQARRNVGVLFDDNRLNYETGHTLEKLTELQLPDGSWPWFPGGRGNDYITLYITTGFGRMRHLGVDVPMTAALRSLDRLDNWVDGVYREILRNGHADDYHLNETIALYLYGRSFFLKDRPIAAKPREAVNYFLAQSKKYWLPLANRQSQGHLALALHRFGDAATAQAIMRSIKERAVTSAELGMFWRDTELSWWWYRAPIETQALMIEAFDEVTADAPAVEECKIWLLKQKQTQDWKTTKATADSVYALLLRGANGLASDKLVAVSVGGSLITPVAGRSGQPAVEAGTGFFERRFPSGEIKPKLGEIQLKKVDAGIAWGGVYWQYFEDMSAVSPFAGTPLKLRKTLYRKITTKQGRVLEPVSGSMKVGDELVVRIELRTDRDMEYVHLKDQRGSGTEPLNTLSGYRYQDGLAYYESTRDTASHFFIDYLPKGVYVFEYSTRVVLRGQYQTGVAEIQCLYAPEFSSHSESVLLTVR